MLLAAQPASIWQVSSERKLESAGVSIDLRDELHRGGGGGQESY